MEIKDRGEVKEYLALKKAIKYRVLDERSAGMTRKQELEETFAPVVAANAEMTRQIVDEITPITEQVRKMRQTNKKPYGPLTETFLQKYTNDDVDKLFGIRYENAIPWIGNQVISILTNDDIKVNGKVYEGTPGLWSLITHDNPKEFTFDDLINYKQILYDTSALHQHYDASSRYPRASRSMKWKKMLSDIWNEFKMSSDDSSDDDLFEDSFTNTKDL